MRPSSGQCRRVFPPGLLLAAILAAAVRLEASGTTLVTGTVTGSDGRAPGLATVELVKKDVWSVPPVRTVPTDNRGHFEVPIEDPGFYYLRFSAPDHQCCSLPVVIEPDQMGFVVSLRLARNAYRSAIDTVRIVGDWNGFDPETAGRMTRESNGTYSWSGNASSDTLAYQLMDLVEGDRSINGTQSDYLVYDGGGDYRSVVRTRPGRTTIAFDPRRLTRSSERTPEFRFAEEDRWAERILQINQETQELVRAWTAAYRGYGRTNGDPDSFRFDISGVQAKFARALLTENDLPVAHFLVKALAQIPGARLTPDLRKRILQVLPLNSGMWLDLDDALEQVSWSIPEGERDVFWRHVLEESPSRFGQARALVFLLHAAGKTGKSEDVVKIYKRLSSNYGDVPGIQSWLRMYDPGRRIQSGRPVPDFELPLLGSEGTVTNRKLLGSTFLIDFWATWCGPCKGEMPNLQAAYDRFHEQGFTIVSVSLDTTPEKVTAYRAGKWKMPWLHTFLPGMFENEVARAFEVKGIPKPILVGPDGTILEDGVFVSLQGESLVATIEKHLGAGVRSQ